jgi:SAM-dependent methyltransferase
LLVSALPVIASHSEESAPVDESARIPALRELRRRNAAVILSRLAKVRQGPLQGLRLCDIGSGYGWFLEEAARLGCACLGIEPDPRVGQSGGAQTSHSNFSVRIGQFPDALDPEERFDVLCFNDVLEHLPDIDACLAACHRHLAPEGLLSIAIPSSEGLFYRLSALLSRFGFGAGFDRLWQKGFDYPHLYFFNSRNLPRLLASQGFQLVASDSLPGLQLSSLWQRLRMSKTHSLPFCVLAYAGILLLYPIALIAPKDILHQIYTKAC